MKQTKWGHLSSFKEIQKRKKKDYLKWPQVTPFGLFDIEKKSLKNLTWRMSKISWYSGQKISTI